MSFLDQAAHLRQLALESHQLQPKLKKEKIKSRIITVTSGKGGVGKTSLVVNLALAFAQLGKRVTILDADLGLANIDVMLGVVPQHTLYDVVHGRKNLAEIAIRGPEGIILLPGGSGLTELADLPEDKRISLINKLQSLDEAADIILIDTGAGLSRTVLSFVAAADEMLLVTTPEPTAIRDAYGIIKGAAKQQLQQKMQLIVNQVKNAQEGKEIAERLITVSRKFLQVELQFIGSICSDQRVVMAVKQQQPFLNLFPHSQAAENVRRIAAALLAVPVKKTRGLPGFLNRLIQLWEKA